MCTEHAVTLTYGAPWSAARGRECRDDCAKRLYAGKPPPLGHRGQALSSQCALPHPVLSRAALLAQETHMRAAANATSANANATGGELEASTALRVGG